MNTAPTTEPQRRQQHTTASHTQHTITRIQSFSIVLYMYYDATQINKAQCKFIYAKCKIDYVLARQPLARRKGCTTDVPRASDAPPSVRYSAHSLSNNYAGWEGGWSAAPLERGLCVFVLAYVYVFCVFMCIYVRSTLRSGIARNGRSRRF